EPDPFSSNRAAPLHYFVPGRRTGDDAHQMNVIVAGLNNFGMALRSDDFIMVSTGSDNDGDFARNVQNTHERTYDTDYLIWPPLVTLVREELLRTRQLRCGNKRGCGAVEFRQSKRGSVVRMAESPVHKVV